MNRLRKFSLKFFLFRAMFGLCFFIVTWKSNAQRISNRDFDRPLTGKATDTVPPARPPVNRPIRIESSDTSVVPGSDSTRFIKTDTFSLRFSKDTLSAPVNYYAEDSVVVHIRKKKITLHGKTKTEYEDVNLQGPWVEIDQETQLITARNQKDSAGTVLEEAQLTQGDQTFISDTIQFNFKSQKGIAHNTITQQSEFFVGGAVAKKVSEDVTFISRGRFTTCNLDHPHFAFMANKLKVINKKMAVSGPVHPEFEGVPVPIYLPFGLFPLSSGRHSGMLPPQFATNDQMGLGLEGLGYYKVINDYWDAKLYGNVYSYGSWSANINPTYYRRYRYRGAFNFGLQKTKRNFKGDPDYTPINSYTLSWNHSMDQKARPGVTFSANVNASSTRYNQNVPNSPQLNFQNLMGSSITYSKTWVDKPYNLTISANHSQNNYNRLVNIALPDMGFTVSTLYPFQKKDFAGSKKWYEQLGIAYNGNFRNSVSFYDTAFKLRNLLDTLQWGAQHNIPITLSLPPILGGAIVVSPSVSYSQVWISQTFERHWNSTAQKLDTVVKKGFFMDQQASFGLSFNTAMFGTFNFKKGSKVQGIRHVIRPSIGLNYRPDLSSKYYYTTQINAAGNTQRFSKLQGGIYSGYSEGRTGGLAFQLDNNLEMKMRSKDSTGNSKPEIVRLIEGFGVSTNYNFLADSLKLAPFNFYFRTNLFQKININANAIMNPYQTDSFGNNIDKYAWESGKFKLGQITSGSLSFSTTFQSKPRDQDKDKKKKEEEERLMNDPTFADDRQRMLDYMRQNPSEFVDFNIPWQISLSYSLYFARQIKSDYSGYENVVRSSANFSGSFSLTPKWNFTMNGFYDFDTKKLQTFSMSINREMHCWQMAISVTPIGIYRFFNVTISPKASVLQDLRINRTRSFFTGY